MFSKMFSRIIIFCLFAVFFFANSMLYTAAWESAEADKKCEKKIHQRWDPYACGGYNLSECASKSVEFKADPGPCIGDYPGWECDQNGPTEACYVGTVECYVKTAVHPRPSVCSGDETVLTAENVATCRDRKKS